MSEVEPRAWLQPAILVEPKPIDVAHINLHHQYSPSENQNHRDVIDRICQVLIASRDALNQLDTHGGDGDSGTTLADIATRIQEELENLPLDNLADLLQAIGQILSSVGGGSIGVLLSLLFTHAGIAMTTSGDFARGLKEGVEIMMKYAGSKLGDRSMLDALVPALQGLERGENLQIVAANARAGANLTSNMTANVGRAANTPPEIYSGFNDSGSEAVALVFARLADNR
jgi:dihydroxyacetone kinase